MTSFDDEDFNVSEYERRRQKIRRRLTVCLIVLAAAALVGMVLFWR